MAKMTTVQTSKENERMKELCSSIKEATDKADVRQYSYGEKQIGSYKIFRPEFEELIKARVGA
ncbi:MAG: hypothetical protein M1528_00110 [Candidatus Marsarchaeota archaeon]|nr:hypothetical protein [Candidatus Marsarchaeota archaeon]